MQPSGVHHDDVIEALASDRADDPFRVRVLPRRSWGCSYRLHVHAGDGGGHVGEDRIPIVEEISWRIMLRKSIAELLCGPGCGRMRGDRHVDDPSTVAREDDQYVQQPERGSRYDEEVGGHDLARVIGQKRSPGLGRWTWMPSHVFGHSGLTHRDPQLQELSVNPRGTP